MKFFWVYELLDFTYTPPRMLSKFATILASAVLQIHNNNNCCLFVLVVVVRQFSSVPMLANVTEGDIVIE